MEVTTTVTKIHPLLTTPELCAALNLSKPVVLGLARDGRIPHIRVGKALRYDLQAVMKALQV